MSGGKVKKGSMSSRGYIGYHTTWDGKRVFLRSKCEFIYARTLDKNRVYYLMEKCTYDIDGKSYKPDFFIYKSSEYKRLIKIIETKGLDDKSTALKYLNLYKDYFTSIGIEYDVIWKYQALITKYNLKKDVDKWIEDSLAKYDFISDSRGELNPMFGRSHRKSTKELIGRKCRERNASNEYKKKCSESQAVFWKTARGQQLKKECGEARKKEAKVRLEKYIKDNPILETKCKECGTMFLTREIAEFCKVECIKGWRRKNVEGYGKHQNSKSSHRTRLKTISKKIIDFYAITLDDYLSNLAEYIQKAKADELIPRNKGISYNTLAKYNLDEELKWEI